MKVRVLACITVILLLSAAMFGYGKRQSYTDLSSKENYLDELYVAEIPAQFAVESCGVLERALPEMPYIFRVEAVAELENLFGISRQLVRVVKIYAGENIALGEEIYLISNHWMLSLNGDFPSMERGFINVLEVGKEYLVFISKQVISLYDTCSVYKLYDDTNIVPVFRYDHMDHVIAPTSGESTYVPYGQVRNNEFFAESEEALAAWSALKSKMLSMYSE